MITYALFRLLDPHADRTLSSQVRTHFYNWVVISVHNSLEFKFIPNLQPS